MIDEGTDGWKRLLIGERAQMSAHVTDSFTTGEFIVRIESDVEGYDTRVLALPHTPECLAQLQAAHDARQTYLARWPFSCRACDGTGEREVGSNSYDDPPVPALCPQCVKQTICPRCGLTFAMQPDGSEPCRDCGFEVGEDGMPERAFCVCGADRALYEDCEVLPDFPE